MSSSSKCFLCNSECEFSTLSSYNCQICGSYTLDYRLQDRDSDIIKKYEKKRHLIAGYLVEMRWRKLNADKPVDLTLDKIDEILASEKIPHTTMQKLNKALLFMYSRTEYIGQLVGNGICNQIVYAMNNEETASILQAMSDIGWLKGYTERDSRIILSIEGLRKAEELIQTENGSQKVFVAMQFREVKGYEYYKTIRDVAIKPAVSEATNEKLIAFTVDEENHNDYITNKMIAEIKTSKFIICDLTHNNLGAYWEAGFAKGLGKEVIYICNKNWLNEKDENDKQKNYIHFDITQINRIEYTTLEDLKEKLIDKIRSLSY